MLPGLMQGLSQSAKCAPKLHKPWRAGMNKKCNRASLPPAIRCFAYNGSKAFTGNHMASNFERQYFPDGVEYPGHPNALALLIMEKYPSYAAASQVEKGKQYAPALVDEDIPGAGGNVHQALDLLEIMLKVGPHEAFERGNKLWVRMVGPGTGNIEKAFEPGQAQVNLIESVFLEKARFWDAEIQAQHAAEKISSQTPEVGQSTSTERPRPRI
jgi:hypothetical protein